MEKEHRGKTPELNLGSLFFGLTLILAGLFFISSRTGFISFTLPHSFFWLEFFWPIIFITIGLALIRVRSLGAKIIGVVGVFIIIFFLATVFLNWFGGFRQNYYFEHTIWAPHPMPDFKLYQLPNSFKGLFE